MREEENLGYWPQHLNGIQAEVEAAERDLAWTREDKKRLMILALLLVAVGLVCCGAGIGLGVAFA